MSKTQEVVLGNGKKVTLQKPKAGIRNQAAIKATTEKGLNNLTFMVELLPCCIVNHEWGAEPLKQALNNLEIEDYDLLVDTLRKIMKPVEDIEGK